MTNIYRDLQLAVAAYLTAEPWFNGTPPVRVLTEDLGNVAHEIEKDLEGTGLTIVVVTPKIARGDENDPASRRVSVVVGVGENPTVNRGPTGTQRRSDDVACVIEAMLSQHAVLEPWTPLEFIERTTDMRTSERIEMSLVFETRIRVERVEESE